MASPNRNQGASPTGLTGRSTSVVVNAMVLHLTASMTRTRVNGGVNGKDSAAFPRYQIFRLRKRDPTRAKRQAVSAARVIPIRIPAATLTALSRPKS